MSATRDFNGLIARLTAVGMCGLPASAALAHGVSDAAKQQMIDGGPLDFALAGAEHMLTGYDHLLLLLGALFLLPTLLDILKFTTAFTLGHTATLLGATLLGVQADHYLIDAFIALTVVYIAWRNLEGRRGGAFTPPLVALALLFGLVHGFGLSTGIQEMTLRGDPSLPGKLVAFNVGVEVGQVAALAGFALLLRLWVDSPARPLLTRITNVAIAVAGVALFAMQLHGFASEPRAAAPRPQRTTG